MGSFVGFAKASPHASTRAVRTRGLSRASSVYVAAEVHGRGIGDTLYARLIPLLRAQGYVTLLAE